MKRFLLQIISFIMAFIVHFIYSSWSISKAVRRFGGADDVDYLLTYFDRFDFITGLTWGVAAPFIVYAIVKYLETGRFKGVMSGIIAAGIIFTAAYFFLGCNGSFLFNFYVKRIGWFYPSLIKPLTLLITIISTITGYILISRKTR